MQTKLPRLALGTWLMGGTKEPDPENDDQRDLAVIRLAVDSGITLIDTAQNYANGRCEELVGQAIADRPRKELQILTKQNRQNLSYDKVVEGCHASLRRLGVDCIDYFVCHAPNPDFELADFFKASNKLYKDGLIRNVGVSNFGIKALEIAVATSELPIALNQVSFSINDSDILTSGTYEFCLKNDIPIQAYRPLADIKKGKDTFGLLTQIAEAMNLSPHQVLIAYLDSYESVHFTIRASTSEHWEQIKAALDVRLSSADLDALKQMHLTKKGVFGHFLEM